MLRITCLSLLSIVSLALLAAAAGCDGTSPSPASRLRTPPTEVSGAALKGRFVSGTAALYSYTGGARSARPLATTLLSGAGGYRFEVFTTAPVLCVEVTSGAYIDEATGAQVRLAQGQT
ncbi:MAG: hypothetical protein HY719_13285, partial [Planctomycetes bacterium]|nr:hypothetical protein [Planctomycetota bacterium]